MYFISIILATILTVPPTICSASRLQDVLQETWAGMNQGFWAPQSTFEFGKSPIPAEIAGVGISLSPSNAMIAVALKNNSYVTFQSDSEKEYQEVMKRLSLPSSMHLAPPYQSVGDELGDRPRQLQRQARKMLGLPASHDVGVLSRAISQLLQRAESVTGTSISSSVVSVPHLVAIYEEDILDMCEYVGIESLKPRHYAQPILLETASVYAGYGLGLCANPRDVEGCTLEEAAMKEEAIFHIDYSEDALLLSFSSIGPATYLYEPGYRHVENFELGFKALEQQGGDNYWEHVAGVLRNFLETFKNMKAPAKIMMTGNFDDSLGVNLERNIQKSVGLIWRKDLAILRDDPRVIVAKGAAEFARRARYV